jgi:hypothetical protein
MTDFSEMCPLFETGVFTEFTFPEVSITDISSDANALMFSVDAKASTCADFNFGRTIVITDAWVRSRSAPAGSGYLHLVHHATLRAAGTIFGTFSMTVTVVGHDRSSWVKFQALTDTTFDSAAILGLRLATATTDPGALIDLMIRYKEK